jgi:hypothetical protein
VIGSCIRLLMKLASKQSTCHGRHRLSNTVDTILLKNIDILDQV